MNIENNQAVKKILRERGIKPENHPALDDIKKLQRESEGDQKKILNQTKKK